MTRCCSDLHNSNHQVKTDLKAVPAGKVALVLNKDHGKVPKLMVLGLALVLDHELGQLHCQLVGSQMSTIPKTKMVQELCVKSLLTKLVSNACIRTLALAKPSQMTRRMTN